MQLKDRLLKNTETFCKKIKEFPGSQFNLKPDENSWSAAEVLEHIYRSEFGIPRLFTGETQTLTNREPDSLVPKMEERFLNSDTKMKASGVILPTKSKKNKRELIEKFRRNREKIAQLTEDLDPEKLCLTFEHPVFGLLTRMEWVHFNIIHTLRHIKQLDRIQSEL